MILILRCTVSQSYIVTNNETHLLRFHRIVYTYFPWSTCVQKTLMVYIIVYIFLASAT